MQDCKATNATCSKCKRRGHYDSVCCQPKGSIPKTHNTRHTTNFASYHPSAKETTPIINIKFKSEKKKTFEIPVILDTGLTSTNVRSEKKNTKCSSNTLLRLVFFFSEQTLLSQKKFLKCTTFHCILQQNNYLMQVEQK